MTYYDLRQAHCQYKNVRLSGSPKVRAANSFSFLFAWVVLAFVPGCSSRPQNGDSIPIDSDIAELKQQLQTSPDSPSLHHQLSALLAEKHDWEASDRESRTAMKLAPHDPMLWIDAAQTYRSRGLEAKALEMLNHAVEIDPLNPLSHFALGSLYERESNPAKAAAEFQETKRLVETLSLPSDTPEIRNRIVQGTRQEIYYIDQFGKEFLLGDLLKALKKKLPS